MLLSNDSVEAILDLADLCNDTSSPPINVLCRFTDNVKLWILPPDTLLTIIALFGNADQKLFKAI